MTKDNGLIPVTRATYDIMVEKRVILENIIALERKEKALENGNRSENLQDSTVEFHPNLKVNQARLEEIEAALKKVEVTKPQSQKDFVKVGNVVVLKFPDQVVTMTVDGVSYAKNALSLQSPLGLLIKGKKIGDEVELNNKKVIIQEIKFPEL